MPISVNWAVTLETQGWGVVIALFVHWRLSSDDQALLLGLAAGNRAALARYREDAHIGTTRDQYECVGHLLAIHKSLRLLFPRDRDGAYGLMKTRNRAFGGMTPADATKKYGLTGLLTVRTYLDHARVITCGHSDCHS
jgi:hypothetical protein